MTISLWHGDCLDLMQLIPDNYVDLILCDLPYGTTQCKWDSVIPMAPLWEQYKRVAKPNAAIVLTAQTPFDKALGASNPRMLKYEWIWQKTTSTGFLNAKLAPLKQHENVLVFYDKAPVYNPQMRTGHKPYQVTRDFVGAQYGKADKQSFTESDGDRYPVSVLTYPRERGHHPTQKPVTLMEYLIRTYTNEGAVVLDNCMGSGTTGVACVQSGRQFIGIEKDPEYFEIAKSRIDKALNKP
jgi:site-specific DNA-methyltransferase (adenine-specific)